MNIQFYTTNMYIHIDKLTVATPNHWLIIVQSLTLTLACPTAYVSELAISLPSPR